MDDEEIVRAIDRDDVSVDRRREDGCCGDQERRYHGAVSWKTTRRGAFHWVVLKPLFTLIR